MIDQKILDQVALTPAEYDLIIDRLGRAPTPVELGMFGALWSEHCGYKNSKPVLQLFPTSAPHVLQGPGENAGVVDIGDGLAIAMKVESHNHPSAIEPFQGAATGVGGIIRDIFTMGARPIALLDALRFGPLDKARNRHLFEGVVAGISAYGNCIGVPTVGGEVELHESYSGNPLVNVMAVGVLEASRLVRACASGPGNLLMMVGADTGRDGIHGATFASVQLDEESEERRPAVQVGNPFLEKLLIEACLELAAGDDVVGMQDLGAAGLTSSMVETAAKGGWGADIDVRRVARRERGMSAYEVMLSESQERMLVVVKRGHETAVSEIFQRWGLHSDIIGEITAGGMIRVRDGDEVVADVPAALLTDPPIYHRQGAKPAYIDELRRFDWTKLPASSDLSGDLLRLLASPNIASKEYVYQQYDHTIQTNTVIEPGAGDAAVLRIKGTAKAIAVTTDCNGRFCYLDPYAGGAAAVAEASRNVVCVGAKPLALTNCLNFGNPEKPEIFYQLEQAVRGMSEACRTLGIPVVSGNVSLYNETSDLAIWPTPLVGMLGLLEEGPSGVGAGFKRDGDVVVLLDAQSPAGLGGSEFLAVIHGVVAGAVPELDLQREAALQACCRSAVADHLVTSAHDCSGGGIGVALAESCILGQMGARLDPAETSERGDCWLFNEAHSRVVLSLPEANLGPLRQLASKYVVGVRPLGVVSGNRLILGSWIDVSVDELTRVWRDAIPNALAGGGKE